MADPSVRANGWSWQPPPAIGSLTTAERWAWLVLRACDAETDPATIAAWAAAVGSCATTIHDTCKFLNTSARNSRDFARILRVLRRNSGSLSDLEAHIVVADPRTWTSLLKRSGLHGRLPDSVISLDEYLQVQRFAPQSHPGLAALRALLGRA